MEEVLLKSELLDKWELSEEEFDALMVGCASSTEMFANTFCFGPDEAIVVPFDEPHKKILAGVDSSAPKTACGGPRGIGKSKIAEMKCCKDIAFGMARFIVYISKSEALASMRTENIKREMLANQKIRDVFGSIKIAEGAELGLDESFSKKSWVAFPGSKRATLIMPRGCGQQVRGLMWNNRRPDLIIVDDMEDTKEIQSEVQRDKWWTWLLSDVLKCVSQIDDMPSKIFYVDTLKHQDAILWRLFSSSDWEIIRAPICDDEFNSLAPHFRSTESIKKEAAEYREKGRMDIFYLENMVQAGGDETRAFKEAMFKHYQEGAPPPGSDTPLEYQEDLVNIVFIDPAKTVTPTANYTAIVLGGFSTLHKRIYLRRIIKERLTPSDLYKKAIDLAADARAQAIAVEVTSLNEFITQPLRQAIADSGYPIELIELKAKVDKIGRAGAMHEYYAKGQVYHSMQAAGYIEPNLMSWPYCAEWDVIDAWGYFVPLLQEMEVLFPGLFQGDYLTEKRLDKMYKALEHSSAEPLRNKDWMLVDAIEMEMQA